MSGLAESPKQPVSFGLLFSGYPLPMWVYDLETLQILDANDAAVDRYGYSRADFLCMRVTDLWASTDATDEVAPSGALPFSTVRRHRRKDGTIIDVHILARQLTFHHRPAVLVVAHDITELRRAAEAAKARRALQNRAVRLSEVLARPRSFSDMLPAIGTVALQLSGAGKGALFLRRADGTVTCPWTAGLPAELGAEAAGDPHDLPGLVLASPPAGSALTLPDGRVLESGSPFLWPDVETLPPDSIIRRGASRHGYRAVGIWPLTYDMRVVAVITCHYERPQTWSRDEEEAFATFARLAATALENGRLYDAQAQSAAPPEREHELRAAKDEAERASHAKSEFLSRMSHELRTPLNAILGFGQLLAMDSLPAEHRDSVEHIVKAGRHLLGLIDEVLDIARIETGRLAVSPEPVGITEALDDVLTLVAPLAAARHVRFRRPHDGPVGRHVLADRRRLRQVLLNLLSNAVKYNRDGGEVVVSCEAIAGERIRIKVTDTGSGIPADKMRRLFTPFDRLDAEQTGIEGSGLGLNLSKRLTEAMGGALGVESQPGQGSTFWVDLPAGAVPALDSSPDVETAKLVLYVEDNLSNLKLIQRLLVQRPHIRLLPAMQGRLGAQLAIEHHPDLILLDLDLSDIPGDELLRALRESPETHDIPVVVISTDATPGEIERRHAAGAWRCLAKPIDVKKFLAAVEDALEHREPK